MNYIKYKNSRFVLPDDGINPEDSKLTLKFLADNWTFDQVKEAFNKNLDYIVIYGRIVQEDGRETDEYIAQYFDKQTKLINVSYDIESDTYSVILVEHDITDERLTALEEKTNELPVLVSAFTNNAEPTGVATRYYEVDELIAIYDKDNYPITVIVTQPISYKQPIIIGLNCEKYLGGSLK